MSLALFFVVLFFVFPKSFKLDYSLRCWHIPGLGRRSLETFTLVIALTFKQ